jgi:hypothetical protein
MHLFIAAILLLPIAVRAATLKHESEVSILSAGGNTELETYNSKTSNRWQ